MIDNVSKINYQGNKKTFIASVNRLQANYDKKGINLKTDWQVKDMIIYASYAGNLEVVQYLIEEKNADPHLSSRIYKAENYPILAAMSSGSATNGSSFREIISYLLTEHNVDPSVANNAIIELAESNGLGMFASDRRDYHESLIQRILKDKRVISKILTTRQERYYKYVDSSITDTFLF